MSNVLKHLSKAYINGFKQLPKACMVLSEEQMLSICTELPLCKAQVVSP